MAHPRILLGHISIFPGLGRICNLAPRSSIPSRNLSIYSAATYRVPCCNCNYILVERQNGGLFVRARKKLDSGQPRQTKTEKPSTPPLACRARGFAKLGG